MKKIIFLVFAFILTSCTVSDASAYEVMTELSTGDGYTYINDSDISSDNYISEERMGYLYYGEETAIEELSYTESYCIYIAKSVSPSEIHIFKTKYQSDVDKLKRMLQSRADILSKPQINPNSSDFFCATKADCSVFSKGRFVFLIVGDTEERIKNIEKLF